MAQSADPLTAPSARRPFVHGRARLRSLFDRIARLVVTTGGLAVIASILGILVFLFWEVAPLLGGAGVELEAPIPISAPAAALLVDEHRTHVGTLDLESGRARVYALPTGTPVLERPLADDLVAARAPSGEDVLAALGADGRAHLLPLRFDVVFDDDTRRVVPVIGEPFVLDLGGTTEGGAFAARSGEDGAAAVARLASGELVVAERRIETNPFLGETTETFGRTSLGVTPPLTRLELDPTRRFLYAATRSGQLLWWDLASERPSALATSEALPAPASALALLNGGRALVVGREDGGLGVWFVVRDEAGRRLAHVREFPAQAGAIREIAPSQRGRSFLVSDASGGLGLYYSTSRRTLWTGEVGGPASALVVAPKGDGAFVASNGGLERLAIENRHPEISFDSLFGKVWYEGAAEPAYVWQSTGGSDEFEPKLSLVPLLIGTLKGTLYSLLLAVPLAVLGAMYTSQFMHPTLQRYVKPTVELMASLPSVVLGFIAGLWLAPRVEAVFPALILMVVFLPLALIGGGFAWSSLPGRFLKRARDGTEVAWLAIVAALGVGVCLALGTSFEGFAFGGSFQAWLLETSGLNYDQRNAIVVGLAMGFAVIPIIFAIAEDSFSNVPAELTAGSRALGATRLQTVLGVVLPTASPGIFSGVMVGFGRAVGETMIVLMATGNTPVLDWNPFNGFRTLSANIAVEIPEAPLGGTLYRTLFVAALLLFAFTFLLNTAAEVIRHRLRERYARL